MTDNQQTQAPSGEVLISYSWDDKEHVTWALEFCNRLRADGIDAIVDQYEDSPPEGWPKWMDRKVRDCQIVLVVCTRTYYRRVMGDEIEGKGLGVRWESALTYQHIYNAGGKNAKFIPVLRRTQDQEFIPTPLQGTTHYCVESDDGYEKLYARLLNRGAAKKPKLGSVRRKAKRQVKTNVAMYLMSPIDLELWDKARWKAVFYLWNDKGPPLMGLAFEDAESARRIFKQWNQRFGEVDLYEELRVSIIEGDIPGKEKGYSVHIGIDLKNVLKRYENAGLHVADNDYLTTMSRIHRMNPEPNSPYLGIFKQQYLKFKSYRLVPGTCKPDGSDLQPMIDLAIQKRTIHFRNVREITGNDEDIVVTAN